MSKSKAIIAALTVVLMTGFTGCDSILETEPAQSVSPGQALTNYTGTEAIALSAYNRYLSSITYGADQVIYPDALADGLTLNPGASRYQDANTNEIGSGVGGWGTFYDAINDANYVINGVDDLSDPEATQVRKDRLKAEMLFVRALAYHDLVKTYAYDPTNPNISNWNAGVIIRTEPTLQYSDADLRSRSTVEEVYTQIEDDLTQAITLFSKDGVDRENVFFASKAASEALLARVYLFWGKYAEAETQATNALNDAPVGLAAPADVPTMFQTSSPDDNNPESIFELRMASTESPGINEAASAALTPLSWFAQVPTDKLMNDYETGDARLGWYAEEGGIYYSTKFYETGRDYADNIPVLRVAEVYLIRAEARIKKDTPDKQGAISDIDALRQSRGLAASGLTTGDTESAIMQVILDERFKELAVEGHRWFDLKRLGMEIPKPGGINVPSTDFRMLDNIPQNEVENNPNLDQNPGY